MLTDQTQTEVINLTPAAVSAVKEMLAERNLEGYALRVFVSGGGCSGLRYGMALDNNIREQDLSCDFDNVKVVVDDVSIDYLRGATVDYIDNETGAGFAIDNPNQTSSCGCGSESSGCSGCG
jgi:iron-sulfur cluster assembly accessory protein